MPTSARVASRATRSSRPSRLACLALAAACAGCGGHARPRITVDPPRSLSTQPVAIRIAGVAAHTPLTLTIRSRDAAGTSWTSTTRVHGDAVVGAGAIYRLAAAKNPDAYYIWSTRGPESFRTTLSRDGHVLAATTFTRTLGVGPAVDTTLAKEGFVGQYSAPAGAGRRPAVLLLGGAEGGLYTGYLASSLSARGYATLALAYFDAPGLPQQLRLIPLEYFARALRWLAAQPRVDPRHIDVLGISRGSEAAQLLGLHYPALVHGVVAVVPSDLVHDSGWTFHGKPVPYAESLGGDARARIPDERIRGPVLFICAAVDEIWPSCSFARDAMSHMRSDPYAHRLVVAQKSGHGVGTLVPFEPAPGSATPDSALNERGRDAVWPKLLAFLKANA